MMRVFMIVLALGVMNRAVWAQEPRITVTVDQEEVIVGQPFIVGIQVLVPTFMPKAPVFPTFEVPGLIVRLPERSTGPISEKIDGETWSGVRRNYRIYPTRAGIIEISAQQLSIVYKDTDTNEDVPLTVEVPATQVRATVPSGARSLEPLIIAQDIIVDQTWEAGEGELAVGEAVVRSLDISVSGASALFVPPLLENTPPRRGAAQTDTSDTPDISLFLPYPEDAKVTETIERGIMSGTRHEQVSYIAQDGGTAVFPDIMLRWYNIETGDIEEINLEGRRIAIAMPPVTRQPLDATQIARIVILILLVAVLAWACRKFLWPRAKAMWSRLFRQYDATTYAAHRIAMQRAKERDLSGFLVALDTRTRRGCPPGSELVHAITDLTKSVYGTGSGQQKNGDQWHAIQRALHAEQPHLMARHGKQAGGALPTLNPFVDPTTAQIFFQTRSKD